MKFDIYQLDAFASRVFAGNPALVCRLDKWPDDGLLQSIAAQHGMSVVAFLVDRRTHFDIRYFTPLGELALVGHASLAAAYVVLRILRPDLPEAALKRRNGPLTVSRLSDGLLAITLPVLPAHACAAPAELRAALGVACNEVRVNQNQYFVFLDDETTVSSLSPDMDLLMKLDRDGVIVTAPGDQSQFVSRAFAPKEGLPEDPVCGSAHLALVPYWSDRLGRTDHLALQLSPRGGELHCSLNGNEVRLAGHCALYMEGTIHI
jgi:PhzF family phenazine biosynthesis protein